MAAATFPIFLTPAGQTALIAGGSEVLLRKARLLAPSGANLLVLAPMLDAGFTELTITHEPRAATPADLAGKVLVFADADTPNLDALVLAARAGGVPLNVPDRPELSSFIMPAIVERGPITVAISTGGAAPVLARRIKSWIERLLPARLGELAEWLDGLRRSPRARALDFESRRRLYETLLDGAAAEALLAGDEPEAARHADAAFVGQIAGGSVALVGAGPGDPDLLTLSALRFLADAEVILHDPALDPRLLQRARRDARRVTLSRGGDTTLLLIAEARAGRRVVRLSLGTASSAEAAALRAAGVACTLVPGVTALSPAPRFERLAS